MLVARIHQMEAEYAPEAATPPFPKTEAPASVQLRIPRLSSMASTQPRIAGTWMKLTAPSDREVMPETM